MQLNGAIDRDNFGCDIKTEILSGGSTELPIKGCCGWSVQNLGNVPVRIDGIIDVNTGSCNSIEFPDFLHLDYVRNLQIEWLSDGVVDPDFRLRVVRVYIVKKQ